MNNKARYPNEHSFVAYFTRQLKKMGHFVQRIESGITGKGIPDLFAVIKGIPMWIEFKREHYPIKRLNKISWRPGQRAWLKQVGVNMSCYTIVMFDDTIGVIMHGYFPNKPLDYPKNNVARERIFESNSMSQIVNYITSGLVIGA